MNESKASGRKAITDLPKAGLLPGIREFFLDYQDVFRSQLFLQLFSNLPSKKSELLFAVGVAIDILSSCLEKVVNPGIQVGVTLLF